MAQAPHQSQPALPAASAPEMASPLPTSAHEVASDPQEEEKAGGREGAPALCPQGGTLSLGGSGKEGRSSSRSSGRSSMSASEGHQQQWMQRSQSPSATRGRSRSRSGQRSHSRSRSRGRSTSSRRRRRRIARQLAIASLPSSVQDAIFELEVQLNGDLLASDFDDGVVSSLGVSYGAWGAALWWCSCRHPGAHSNYTLMI